MTRQVFLGASRDYMVETPDGTALRVTTPTENAVPRGTEVWLMLPPERCRALEPLEESTRRQQEDGGSHEETKTFAGATFCRAR